MDSEKLKPCPFCGCKAELILHGMRVMVPNVMCSNCFAMMGADCMAESAVRGKLYFKTEEEAIEAWNRRNGENETDPVIVIQGGHNGWLMQNKNQ